MVVTTAPLLHTSPPPSVSSLSVRERWSMGQLFKDALQNTPLFHCFWEAVANAKQDVTRVLSYLERDPTRKGDLLIQRLTYVVGGQWTITRHHELIPDESASLAGSEFELQRVKLQGRSC